MCFGGEIFLLHGRWDGCFPDDWAELREFTHGNLLAQQVGSVAHGGSNQFLPAIRTAEGVEVIHKGDMVLRDTDGKFSRHAPEVFSVSFEEVPAPSGVCETCGGRRFLTGFVATPINPKGDMPCPSCNMM